MPELSIQNCFFLRSSQLASVIIETAIDGEAIDFLESGHAGLLEFLLATHSGTTTAEFEVAAETWIREARHPVTDRPYPAMVYQPMIELLAYLERNGFSNWIVSGGGADFMRVFAEETYGIPPGRVIGSEIELEHRSTPEGGVLVRMPGLETLNDGPQKVIGIHRAIGRRPVAAFGNSDGDLAMLARHDAAALARLVSAPTMKQFHFAAQPFAGYAAGSDDPLRYVQRSRTPLLCISAEDDPLCVAANVADAKAGGLLGAKTMTILAQTKRGSHLGFYEGFGARRRWAERAAFEFLNKALETVEM